MVLLRLKIRDWTYSKELNIPTVTQPPIIQPPITPTKPPIITPTCPQFVPPSCAGGTLISQPNDPVTGCPRPPICQPKPSQETRIVKILPEGQNKFPDANEGQEVKITASVYCKSGETITKPRDTAYLIVDGAIYDEQPIKDGVVTFSWTATAVPISLHNICIKVNPSQSCRSPGQDCRRMSVSSTRLGSAEQLAAERESAREQRRLLEEARQRLRQEIVGAELTSPTYQVTTTPTITPILTSPTSPTLESPTLLTSPTAPTTTVPQEPDIGNIEIVSIPIPIVSAVPIYVYIDDQNKGRLYETPKTITNIPTGSHTVYIIAGDFSSPVKTVTVFKDKTTQVSI